MSDEQSLLSTQCDLLDPASNDEWPSTATHRQEHSGYGQATNPPQATTGALPQPVIQPSAGALPQPVIQPSAGALPQPVTQPSAGALPKPDVELSAGALPQPVMQPSAGALPQPVMQPSVQLPTTAQPQMFWTVGPNGQLQMFYASAGIPAQPMPPQPMPPQPIPAQPIPQAVAYTPQVAPAVQPVTGVLPPKLQPYSYLKLSYVVLIVCAILNITSLAFGIPAILLSLQSEERKRIAQYEKAKQSGTIALILNLINMTYTFFTITLAIGLTLGLLYNYCEQDYYNCGY